MKKEKEEKARIKAEKKGINMKGLGAKLSALREERHWSKTYVAKQLKMNLPTYAKRVSRMLCKKGNFARMNLGLE
ncbi:hypothetical protein [Limosilactobacillus fermentum]|uniref:hypothetical protein n=1 Tax=Limosilactobacillus fermentum TaxID=1613 RepID=UPI0019658361|nr:hypothetical protein [Limosilactobacillus fermentum]MBM9560825.1 hypothetical protein [Limosilactobacillus fermentum]